jgi:hypothetical protein
LSEARVIKKVAKNFFSCANNVLKVKGLSKKLLTEKEKIASLEYLPGKGKG